ncbi:MAG TPA: ribulose-phosphate 3-epimerase [archaeon]|nr:ribulose-phosphate 3-epimerase [archaeon]
MAQISASVLNADFSKWKKWLPELKAAKVERIHWDIMDNKYVPNNGVSIDLIKEFRPRTQIYFETHLMTVKPEKYFGLLAMSGVDLAIFHLETSKWPITTIESIRDLGMRVGIAINNKTKANHALPYLEKADLCLVMSVEAGFGGQKFNEKALEKISLLRKKIDEEKLSCKLEVDGGVNAQIGAQCLAAGADILAAGTFIFKHPKGIKSAVKELRKG